LHRILLSYLHHMDMYCRDGYPTATLNGPGQRGSVSDPTGSAATTYANVERAMVEAAIHQANELLRDALADVTRRLSDSDQWRRHQCSGGVGLPGYTEWGNESCREVLGPRNTSGLCDDCRPRRNRWLRENGRAHEQDTMPA
jgi:hypothetical protein